MIKSTIAVFARVHAIKQFWQIFKFGAAMFDRCQLCECNMAGSLNSTCDAATGQCFCKEMTTSRTCSQCVPGTSNIDPTNPYGCSKGIWRQPCFSCVRNVTKTRLLSTSELINHYSNSAAKRLMCVFRVEACFFLILSSSVLWLFMLHDVIVMVFSKESLRRHLKKVQQSVAKTVIHWSELSYC